MPALKCIHYFFFKMYILQKRGHDKNNMFTTRKNVGIKRKKKYLQGRICDSVILELKNGFASRVHLENERIFTL